jgi:hypothetical protein
MSNLMRSIIYLAGVRGEAGNERSPMHLLHPG